MKFIYSTLTLCLIMSFGFGQITTKNFVNDSVTKQKNNDKKLVPKVDHAEPLYIDLMRDLGARKGEAEINVGFGLASYKGYNEYNGFVEYEWAIADHLGMEVEIPFSFNQKNSGKNEAINIPGNKIEGLKFATQYTFLVNEKRKMSMAVAYVHEFEFNHLKQIGHQGSLFTGMRMNPVFVAAKNYSQINTMLYTGPVVEHHYKTGDIEVGATINVSIMYVVPNSKNFVGIENNMEIDKNGFHYTLRPQLKVSIQHNLMIGLVTGIPLTNNSDNKMDVMTRIIWEP